MKSLIRVVLLLALAPLLSAATVVQAPQCPDGRFYASGFCPPNLTSASESNVADTTAQVVLSTTRDSGTLYCVVSTSTTSPLKSEIKAGAGVSIIAAATPDNVNASGERTLAFTGLSAATTYYTYCVHEWQGRDSFVASTGPWVTTGGGGINASRINAIIAGRTAPFTYSMPADPTTSTTCSAATAAQFNACADDAGTQVTITSSFSGNVAVTADDVDVLMSNDFTITGNIAFGGGSYVNRVRWTGGNLVGMLQVVRARDLLIDDLHANNPAAPGEHHLNWGWDGTGNPPFFRVAIINSTLQNSAGRENSVEHTWSLHSSSNLGLGTAYDNEDLILANVKFLSNEQMLRLQNVGRIASANHGIIIIDSVFNPDVLAQNGPRFHAEDVLWVKDSWWRESTIQIAAPLSIGQIGPADDGPSIISPSLFEDNASYTENPTFANQGGITDPNSGTVTNHTMHYTGGAGAFPSISPLTDGGGNTRVAWDGITLPSSVLVGAVRDANEERIATLLAGREPPFAYNLPSDPVTTLTCNATSAATFNACADDAGTLVTVANSFAGNIQIRANDIDVVMDNAYTITGNLAVGDTGLVSRIRWTGGNLVGTMSWWRHNDVLIDDFYAYVEGDSSEDNHTFGKAAFNGEAFFSRMAVINSTFEVRKSDPGLGNAWAFFAQQNPTPDSDSRRHEDLIFLNSKTLATGLHSHRIMSVRRAIYADFVGNPDGTALTGMRIHLGNEDVWFRDSWVRGGFHVNNVSGSDPAPQVSNALLDNVDRYTGTNLENQWYWYFAPNTVANSGEIRNSTQYSQEGAGTGTPEIGSDFTLGTGNSRVSWDGTTVPDSSTIGAIR